MPSKPEVLKERRKSDPEFAERTKGYSKKWRENNPERAKELDRAKAAIARSNDREAYNKYMREWRAKNREEINAKNRDRLKSDPDYAEKVRAADRKRHEDNPLRSRKQNLKAMYGITLEDYDRKYDEQLGKCSICGKERKRGGHDGLVVDHCHTTGKVRELLCSQCNQGIGKFREDESILLNALEYIKRFNKLKE